MNNITKTDVCIVGSGPSGAATSIMLANQKIHHYVIDKATFPRDKTCGDGLILYAYKSMKLLGNHIFEDFIKNPNFLHSKKIKLHVNDKTNVVFQETEDRDMVISYGKRLDFDYFLVKHISKEYATTEFGNGVKRLTKRNDGILVDLKNGKQILAKIVVGADGAQSLVSKKLGEHKINNKYRSTFVSAYFTGVTHLAKDNEAEIRIVYKKTPLFFYIFPLADGQVNVSLGGRSDQLLKNNINLIDEINEIMASHEKVNYKFSKATKKSKWRGWVIPFQFGNQKIIGNRFLLVGDAAGLANAFYKEGVGTGMMSGIIAAKNIQKCIQKNDFSQKALQSYEKDLKLEFEKLLKFSHYMVRFSRFQLLFGKIVSVFKKRIEQKSFKMIQKRSY